MSIPERPANCRDRALIVIQPHASVRMIPLLLAAAPIPPLPPHVEPLSPDSPSVSDLSNPIFECVAVIVVRYGPALYPIPSAAWSAAGRQREEDTAPVIQAQRIPLAQLRYAEDIVGVCLIVHVGFVPDVRNDRLEEGDGEGRGRNPSPAVRETRRKSRRRRREIFATPIVG
eukprot:CAMPEP_0177748730 /NCGR_PEP_ID=MMETSP0484_2-20121128/32095_1 /TAXON_ID=354590 /ORGANISM="Rhodomonas lens, Strain RHODO" /LENGTH=171 /DNA_ID=CAMNT_0019263639 /DNA_START=221 /DNA_END=733 /DNA_ORIENTATION=+